MRTFNKKRQKIALAAALLGVLIALPSWARFKPREDLERPHNRQAAATRSGSGCFMKEKVFLTALVPLDQLGLTMEARPTFHWYMPSNTYRFTEFVLYKVPQPSPSEEEEIYRVRLPLNGQDGVVNYQLPEHALVPMLEVGHEYHWQVRLICDPEDDDPSGIPVANGWLQRIPTEVALSEKLKNLQPVEKFERLAEEGLWYDALQQLDVMQTLKPSDGSIPKHWQTMLESPYVQLGHIKYRTLARR